MYGLLQRQTKNLLKEVEAGNFREDLYYRLDVLQLKVPPLRARTEDVGVLLQHFLRENFNHLSKEEKSRLRKYKWPGNIRELENCALYYKTLGRLPDKIVSMTTEKTVFEYEHQHEKIKLDLLRLLKETTSEGQGLDRNALYSQLKEKGVVVSDVRLRKLLDELKDEQLVEIHQGRKGTNITKKGFLYLQEHIDLLE